MTTLLIIWALGAAVCCASVLALHPRPRGEEFLAAIFWPVSVVLAAALLFFLLCTAVIDGFVLAWKIFGRAFDGR